MCYDLGDGVVFSSSSISAVDFDTHQGWKHTAGNFRTFPFDVFLDIANALFSRLTEVPAADTVVPLVANCMLVSFVCMYYASGQTFSAIKAFHLRRLEPLLLGDVFF